MTQDIQTQVDQEYNISDDIFDTFIDLVVKQNRTTDIKSRTKQHLQCAHDLLANQPLEVHIHVNQFLINHILQNKEFHPISEDNNFVSRIKNHIWNAYKLLKELSKEDRSEIEEFVLNTVLQSYPAKIEKRRLSLG